MSRSTLLQVNEYRVDRMEVDNVKEGEELTKVSFSKISQFQIFISIFYSNLFYLL